MASDPQFDGPEFNTPAVLNVAGVISGYCGRSAFDGTLQACDHDHRGEAVALVRSVMQTEGVTMLDRVLAPDSLEKIAAYAQAERDKLAESAATIPAR